jgi:hypothetical protein
VTHLFLWMLVIVTPVEGAGRQVGPFHTQEHCEQARDAYRTAFDSTPRKAICVKVARI